MYQREREVQEDSYDRDSLEYIRYNFLVYRRVLFLPRNRRFFRTEGEQNLKAERLYIWFNGLYNCDFSAGSSEHYAQSALVFSYAGSWIPREDARQNFYYFDVLSHYHCSEFSGRRYGRKHGDCTCYSRE